MKAPFPTPQHFKPIKPQQWRQQKHLHHIPSKSTAFRNLNTLTQSASSQPSLAWTASPSLPSSILTPAHPPSKSTPSPSQPLHPSTSNPPLPLLPCLFSLPLPLRPQTPPSRLHLLRLPPHPPPRFRYFRPIGVFSAREGVTCWSYFLCRFAGEWSGVRECWGGWEGEFVGVSNGVCYGGFGFGLQWWDLRKPGGPVSQFKGNWAPDNLGGASAFCEVIYKLEVSEENHCTNKKPLLLLLTISQLEASLGMQKRNKDEILPYLIALRLGKIPFGALFKDLEEQGCFDY
ncbi:hypothetical protein CK203_090804 [Vitis vinifera]|uniref:Uncharacterized protein n=1 Tax=Vitis vinifera TaxID=29760 RepID=A0A438BTY0_VITVI|nr:hypothetical protein CK203_090804 [Vitis vinifera]